MVGTVRLRPTSNRGREESFLRSVKSLVLASMLAFGFLVVAPALPAHGCSCAMPDPFGGLAEADGAFVGALVEKEEPAGPVFNSAEEVNYHFEVETVVKGEIGDTVVVKSALEGASCGLESPVGARIGLFLYLEGGEWHSSLCSTVDPDALLTAAEGFPEPVGGSPPHLLVMTSLGNASIVALDREGQIVGYGPGPLPWLVSACPDDETFIGSVSDTEIQVWTFLDLSVVGHYSIAGGGSWLRNLACAGPGGDPLLAVMVDPNERGSLIRLEAGTTELVADDVELLVDMGDGLVVIAGDGSVHSVSEGGRELTEVVGPIGDIRGQVVSARPSPDATHLALSLVDWSGDIVQGRVVVLDLANSSAAEKAYACDIYPTWLDNEHLALWDTCNSAQSELYTADLELVGPADPALTAGYGWTVVDETGATFYPTDQGMAVVEAGENMGAEFGQVFGFPSAALLVPVSARGAWSGSSFIPDSLVDHFVDPPVEEPLPPDALPPEVIIGGEAPAWLFVAASLLLVPVFWLLLRRPRAPVSSRS